MAKGKSINLFLIDGDSTGRIKATLSNWTGIIYKISKLSLYSCEEGGDISRHIKHAGIYFLLGELPNGNPSIYIGQANTRKNGKGLIQRLNEHKNDDNEWNEIVILTRQNDTLDAAELNYLENKFTNLAQSVNRYDVINKCDPSKGNISEEKASEMDEFIENCLAIIGILGIKAFEKIKGLNLASERKDIANKKSLVFLYQGKYKASAILSSEGFVLLKGSQVSAKLHKSLSKSVLKLRQQYSNKIDDNFVTTEDLLFHSQSAAAAFVSGSSTSGNVVWKTSDGLSPKDL